MIYLKGAFYVTADINVIVSMHNEIFEKKQKYFLYTLINVIGS